MGRSRWYRIEDTMNLRYMKMFVLSVLSAAVIGEGLLTWHMLNGQHPYWCVVPAAACFILSIMFTSVLSDKV